MKILSEKRFENELRKERELVLMEQDRMKEMRRLEDRIFELEMKVEKLNWAAEKGGVYKLAELEEQEQERNDRYVCRAGRR